MYTIEFLNYNYDGGNNCFTSTGKKVFQSFVAFVTFCRNNAVYLISDEQIFMCGTRHITADFTL